MPKIDSIGAAKHESASVVGHRGGGFFSAAVGFSVRGYEGELLCQDWATNPSAKAMTGGYVRHEVTMPSACLAWPLYGAGTCKALRTSDSGVFPRPTRFGEMGRLIDEKGEKIAGVVESTGNKKI